MQTAVVLWASTQRAAILWESTQRAAILEESDQTAVVLWVSTLAAAALAQAVGAAGRARKEQAAVCRMPDILRSVVLAAPAGGVPAPLLNV